MSEINASNFKKEHGDLAPDLVGVTELTSPYFFVPPSGTTAERPENCEAGTLRFNTDIGSLEVFRGKTIGWEQIQRRESQYLGGGTGSNAGTGTRGLFGMGYAPNTGHSRIDAVTIQTLGNATDFADLTNSTKNFGCASSSTRGLFCHGANANGPSETNIIDFITIANQGIDCQDFGDSTAVSRQQAGVSNGTRAVFGGGYTEPSSPYLKDIMDYVTIAQTGNAVDFGNLSNASRVTASVSSSTRGVFGLAHPGAGNILEFITISTTGNVTDFGDRTVVSDYPTATSNSTRGLFAGGDGAGDAANNVINFITIATTGNAIDFGDLLSRRTRFVGATSSSTRALFAGGNSPYQDNVIQFVEFSTTGDAVDFGDLSTTASFGATGGTISNGHGGL
jgi:hypothetical protein